MRTKVIFGLVWFYFVCLIEKRRGEKRREEERREEKRRGKEGKKRVSSFIGALKLR
jgi:uncharacterized protein (DUF2225 family)